MFFSDRLQPETVKFSVSMLFGESNQPAAATFITPVLPHGLYAVLQNHIKTLNEAYRFSASVQDCEQNI